MKKLGVCCLILVGLLAAAPVMAAGVSSIKIGIIDTQKIIQEAKAAKNARTVFQKELDAKRAVLDAKGKEILNIREQVKSAAQGPEAARLRDNLAREDKEYKRLQNDVTEELKKRERDLYQKILSEIRQVVEKFSTSEGYTLILEKAAVVSSSDAIDITDRIIKQYDSQKK